MFYLPDGPRGKTVGCAWSVKPADRFFGSMRTEEDMEAMKAAVREERRRLGLGPGAAFPEFRGRSVPEIRLKMEAAGGNLPDGWREALDEREEKSRKAEGEDPEWAGPAGRRQACR